MELLQSLYLDGREMTARDCAALPGNRGLKTAAIRLLRDPGGLEAPHRGHLRLARETGDMAEMGEVAAAIRARATHMAVLGTGGSSLAAQAFYGLATAPQENPGDGDIPRLYYPDNLSPHGMDRLLAGLPAGRSHFLVISKSGGTAETVAQFLACHDHLLAATGPEPGPGPIADHFTVITEPGDRPLRRMAAKLGCRVLDHPTDVGGRFAAFSNVALLPALIAGLDAGRIRAGAAGVLDRAESEEDILALPAVGAAALHHHAGARLGANISVLMPYDGRLANFTRWQQQLWAESLGKAGKGMTPVGAAGPVDQHSQLQLYLDGPADKVFTILHEELAGTGPRLGKNALYDPDIDYLCGHTIGDLVAAQARATIEMLVRRKRPVRVLGTAKFDEFSIGALMMQFMLETEIRAALAGVDAYDQPAVEEGKRLARQYLGGQAGERKQK